MQNRFMVFILAGSLWALATLAWAEHRDISAQQAHQLASAGKVVLVDVRSMDEWEQTGLAVNAHPISMHQAGGMEKFTADLIALVKGDKSQAIALICAGGVRSSRVQAHLKEQGFTHTYSVIEGMIGSWYTKGWIEQALPTVDFVSARNF